MILYLTEDIINESVGGNEVVDAISGRKGVLITYEGEDNGHVGKRYIEPYVYGLTLAGNPCIRAYQYYGDTKTGVPKWKLFRLDRIISWEPTENTFELEPQARGWAAQAFNGEDRSMSTVYAVVDLEKAPETDYEKMQARTRQIRNQKPVNISSMQNTPQQQRQSGPIGQNEPQIQAPSPVQNTEPKTDSKPLNGQGEEKKREEVPPISQEPKQNGPITGNATNPEENKAEDLMSNDQFKEMLRRNLELTDAEKQKRGFSLQ